MEFVRSAMVSGSNCSSLITNLSIWSWVLGLGSWVLGLDILGFGVQGVELGCRVAAGFREGLRRVYGGILEGLWRVYGGFMGRVWRV